MTNRVIISNSLGHLVNKIATHEKNDKDSDEVPRAVHAGLSGRLRSKRLSPQGYELTITNPSLQCHVVMSDDVITRGGLERV